MKYSAALCRGLIEAASEVRQASISPARIPRLYAAASLKPAAPERVHHALHAGIPRLYAAASLKRLDGADGDDARNSYSAALCRGLIEAGSAARSSRSWSDVFRGSMPRPH